MSAAGRAVELRDLFNFRDLGGLPVAEGGTVRRGMLFRGAGLHRISAADAETVAALGLRTVFDLRTPGELHRFGRFPDAGAEVVSAHVPMLPRAWRPGDDDDGGAAELLGRRYAMMLETGRDAVRAVVDRLAERDAPPAVFFCAAGKDRTGVMAALLLGLLGVSDEEIAADYVISEAAMPDLVGWLRRNEPGTGEWIDSLPPALLEAPAAAIATLLATIRERHGGVEAYVLECGADPAAPEALRSALVDWR